MNVDTDAVQTALETGDPAAIVALNRAETITAICEYHDVKTPNSGALSASERIPKTVLVRLLLAITEDEDEGEDEGEGDTVQNTDGWDE